jgi:uncharacterized protein YndB with AHSA1/START domain
VTTSNTVKLTRTFKAPPERVFAAFENPREMAKWMGTQASKTEVHALDVREGGAVRVQMSWENGMSFQLRGTFKKVVRPSLLEFTWGMEGNDANDGLVTVEFAPSGTGTELTLTHEGLVGPALRQAKAGWNGHFDALQTLVDAG